MIQRIYSKRIKVTPEQLKKLAEEHKITETATFNALAFRSNSETAIEIRNKALERGGAEITEVKLVETDK